MSLSSLMQQASIGQDYNTQETRVGTVTRVYTDNLGNVTSADVRLPGQTRSVVNVPNSSGIRLSVGSQANVNFNRGQRHSYNIIAAGNTQTAITATADAATLASASGIPASSPDLSSAPVLLQSESGGAPNGYVATAGANVTLTSVAPVITASGTETSAGELIIGVTIPQYTTLPNPSTTLLPDRTLAYLVNSYGTILGLYELSLSLNMWQLIGGGSSGITELTGDVTASGSGLVAASVVQIQGKPFENPGFAGGQSAFFNGSGFVEYYGGSLGSVYVVAIDNVPLSGVPTIDGVAITGAGTLVLLAGQTTASQNGPWVVNTTGASSGTWARPNWWPSGATFFTGCYIIPVEFGDSYANTLWSLKDPSGLIIDTSSISWVPVASPSASPFLQSITSSATPAINVAVTSQFNITGLAANITGFSIIGTPLDGQKLMVRILDNGTARTITWGSSFASSGIATLLSTTVASKTHLVGFIYDANKSQFLCTVCDSAGY